MTETAGSQPAPGANAQAPKKSWALAAAGWMFLAGAAAVLYVVFSGMSKPAPEAGLARYATGAMEKLVVLDAPPRQSALPFKDASGAERRLSEWRGKVTVVNFWATWCAPCVKEMPTLAALDKAFPNQPFDVVAISLDRPTDHDHAKEQLAKLTGGQLEFLIDTTMRILPDSATPDVMTGMPTTIVYDQNGQELARLAGEADWAAPEAKRLIEAALAGER